MVTVSKLDWRLFQAWNSLTCKDPSVWFYSIIELTEQWNNSVTLTFAPMELLSFLWWNSSYCIAKSLLQAFHKMFHINFIKRIWPVLVIYSFSLLFVFILLSLILISLISSYIYIECYNLQSTITCIILLSLTTNLLSR